MYKSALAALILAVSAGAGLAGEDKNITGKAMDDHPGTAPTGTTADPTKKPDSGSLSEKAMQDQPGVNTGGGSTAMPNSVPKDDSLAAKAKSDAGNSK